MANNDNFNKRTCVKISNRQILEWDDMIYVQKIHMTEPAHEFMLDDKTAKYHHPIKSIISLMVIPFSIYYFHLTL